MNTRSSLGKQRVLFDCLGLLFGPLAFDQMSLVQSSFESALGGRLIELGPFFSPTVWAKDKGDKVDSSETSEKVEGCTPRKGVGQNTSNDAVMEIEARQWRVLR